MTQKEVKDYLNEWGMSLDEFSAHMEETHTKEGLSLDQLAEKWGTSTTRIKLDMDNMGLSMQEWSDRQQDAWEAYESSIKERTEGIINSFEEIPAEYEQTGEEMIEILKANKERYAEWEAAMVEITRQLGPTAAEEFGKLGPEATSAMQEILDSADLLDEAREVFGVKINEVTGAVEENWSDPDFIGAPSDALDSAASVVESNTALSDALVTNVEDAQTAVQGMSLSDEGAALADDLVQGLKDADIKEAMQTIASMIKNNISIVTAAVGQLVSSATIRLESFKTDAAQVASSAMDGISAALKAKAPSLYAQATEIANGIAQAMAKALDVHSPSRVMKKLFMDVMQGAYVGMDNKVGMLYKQADTIADGMALRLSSVSPDMLHGMYNKLQSVTASNLLGGATLTPLVAGAGSGGVVEYSTSLTQNITSPTPLSPSEMTREGQDMLRRASWQLP
jgi:hypothetical protein